MPTRRITPSTGPLPAYQLYGEAGGAPVPERLHVETISARSRHHDWDIRPHRHEALWQLLHLRQGRAEAWLDTAEHPLAGPCVVLAPPLAVHGFRFQPEVQGHVITVHMPHLAQLLAAEPQLLALLNTPRHLALRKSGAASRALDRAVDELAEDFAGPGRWRAFALDSGLLRLLLALGRALPGAEHQPAANPGLAPAQPVSSRATGHLLRYRALVESRYHLQPRVLDLAAELGLTVTQLNRICRQLVGQPAQALLHSRQLLEAQRLLAYTGQSVKRIGMDLGFADPSYFSRFFLRLTGQSPSDWRRQAGRIE